MAQSEIAYALRAFNYWFLAANPRRTGSEHLHPIFLLFLMLLLDLVLARYGAPCTGSP
jgi:hypothetical protein